MTRLRQDVLAEDRWNIESLYPSLADWDQSFQSFVDMKKKPYWPHLVAYQDKLGDGADQVKKTLDDIFSADRKLSALYTYAHLKHDEDITDRKAKEMYEQILACAHAFSQETAWLQPALIGLPDEILNAYLKSPVLKEYAFYIEKIIRIKKHTLSPENEQLLALAGQALQTAGKTYRTITDADFQFGSVLDSQENERALTHATYAIYLREHDRTLRERAFKQYHKQYAKYENTIGELLLGQLQTHHFNSQARHYSSCLEAALFPKNIDVSVYHSLIQAINERLEVLHRYMHLRKKILGLDQLHFYDLYVPLSNDVEIRMPYTEAEDLVIESVAPLGSEYQNILRKGLKEQRWVDRYENKNKRSGAYSSGCFDSYPYILMNYKNIIRDVFTLAHEAGHSMHSYLSHKNQPYQYSDYPIFLAEVASTFNEDLLMRMMLTRSKNKTEKFFLLNQQIEDIRGTLFRQTMFAEFELRAHELVEQNIPITPQLLKLEYRHLNQKYFGPAVTIDEDIEIEWARIPHFYYNFYVFQYSTGISAALALSKQVLEGGKEEREAYLNFLKAGSSRYPIDILKLAGIDMTSSQPVKAAIQKFSNLLDELEKLLV